MYTINRIFISYWHIYNVAIIVKSISINPSWFYFFLDGFDLIETFTVVCILQNERPHGYPWLWLLFLITVTSCYAPIAITTQSLYAENSLRLKLSSVI